MRPGMRAAVGLAALVVAPVAAGACGSGSSTPRLGAQPGVYTFSSGGTVTLNNQPPLPAPARTTVKVGKLKDGRQRQTRTAVDGEGTGSVVNFDYEYRPDGSYLDGLGLETHLNDVVDARTFRPPAPILLFRKNYAIGSHTSFTMTEAGSGITADAQLTLLRNETVTVQGTPISTVVQQIDVKFGGPVKGSARLLLWFDPNRSIVVRDAINADVDAANVRLHLDSNSLLLKLKPSGHA